MGEKKVCRGCERGTADDHQCINWDEDEKKASNDRALRTGWAVVKEDECPCELDSFEEALWKKCVPCIERHNMTVESIGDTTYVLNENQEVVHKW
tara:strand:+ start:4230 stop:4514 length:285 start_codon:yes stop_codon:yes gene_type:complete